MEKSRSDFVIVGCILLFFLSCGIEDYVAIPAPIIPVQTSSYNMISFQHDPGRYPSGSNFQGYEIYYKIYANVNLSTRNLDDDNDWLTQNGSTIDRLIQRGYKRLNFLYSQKSPEPLLDLMSDGNTSGLITVDFTNFINRNPNTINFVNQPDNYTGRYWDPVITLPSGKNFIMFRGVQDNDNNYKKFEYLYKTVLPFSKDNDMAPDVTLTTTNYEICFFIAAFAWSLERPTTYSIPIPLGIITPIRTE